MREREHKLAVVGFVPCWSCKAFILRKSGREHLEASDTILHHLFAMSETPPGIPCLCSVSLMLGQLDFLALLKHVWL